MAHSLWKAGNTDTRTRTRWNNQQPLAHRLCDKLLLTTLRHNLSRAPDREEPPLHTHNKNALTTCLERLCKKANTLAFNAESRLKFGPTWIRGSTLWIWHQVVSGTSTLQTDRQSDRTFTCLCNPVKMRRRTLFRCTASMPDARPSANSRALQLMTRRPSASWL